jgi:hypothetical protein
VIFFQWSPSAVANGLTGSFYVKPTATAMSRAWRLCGGSAREYQILRRHALNLRNFPNCGDWDWIKTAKGTHIGEMRIDEQIAGQDNIRIIFYKAPVTLPGEPLPRIWTLTVFPKKSQDFSKKEVDAFCAMRRIVIVRYYTHDHSE